MQLLSRVIRTLFSLSLSIFLYFPVMLEDKLSGWSLQGVQVVMVVATQPEGFLKSNQQRPKTWEQVALSSKHRHTNMCMYQV